MDNPTAFEAVMCGFESRPLCHTQTPWGLWRKNMDFKKLFFRDAQEQSVDVVQCWEVRWASRHGYRCMDERPEIMVFPSEQEARDFQRALETAFKLIRYGSGTKVKMVKQEY